MCCTTTARIVPAGMSRRSLEWVNFRCWRIFRLLGHKGADSFFFCRCAWLSSTDHVQEDVGHTFEGVHQSRAQISLHLRARQRTCSTRSRTFLAGIVTGIAGSLATSAAGCPRSGSASTPGFGAASISAAAAAGDFRQLRSRSVTKTSPGSERAYCIRRRNGRARDAVAGHRPDED